MAVKTLKEQFEATLAAWAAACGLPAGEAALDADGTLTVTISGSVATLVYRESTDTVICWLECGDAASPTVAPGTLRANDRFARTGGFTVAIDSKTNRVVVHDRRPAERFTSAEVLDAWLQAGVRLASDVRLVAQYGRLAIPKEA